MYFLQVAGPLQLNYTKDRYGPYAENLRHVMRQVEGHLISGYADGGDAPDKPLELAGAMEDAPFPVTALSGRNDCTRAGRLRQNGLEEVIAAVEPGDKRGIAYLVH